MDKLKLAKLILRFGIAATFFGHGYLAMQVQSSWIIFLITVGLDTNQAVLLMNNLPKKFSDLFRI